MQNQYKNVLSTVYVLAIAGLLSTPAYGGEDNSSTTGTDRGGVDGTDNAGTELPLPEGAEGTDRGGFWEQLGLLLDSQ